ncbi:MAG: large subunit ribosomal protein [Patescibacteria group bacterium]|jgi:large subunit ribosomal protein L11|nr:large subunit ribosomal protein [Patescibacteria group bacterium]
MAKKITKTVKMQVPAGKATPAPPLGPTLGQAGVNIGTFVNEFNDRTKEFIGHKVSVVLRVFEDRSFEFDVKTPLTAGLILKAAGIEKGSGKNRTSRAGTITKDKVKEVAEAKMKDLNAKDLAGAIKIVEGQCRSMGIEVK